MHHARAQGNKKMMPEGANMWGTLTAETFTPFLEFDFLYTDVWTTGVLGNAKVGWQGRAIQARPRDF